MVVDRSFGNRGALSVAEGADTIGYPSNRLVVVRGGRQGISVSRYMSNGTPDGSFGGGDGSVIVSTPTRDFGPVVWTATSVAVDPGGKILVAGGVLRDLGDEYEMGYHPWDTVLARLRSGGSLDWITREERNEGPPLLSGTIEAIEMQGKKILVGGSSGGGYEQSDSGFVTRVNPDGAVDATFAGGGTTTVPPVKGGRGRSRFQPFSDVNALLAAPDGQIYVAGSVRSNLMLARLTKNGRLDRRFDTDGIVRGRNDPRAIWEGMGIARDRSGRLIISGPTHGLALALARYTPGGRLDRAFGQGGIVRTRVGETDLGGGVAVTPDGRIVLAGIARHRKPSRRGENYFLTVLRYRASGHLDPLFFGDGVFTRPYGASWFGADSWRPTVDRRGRILVTGGGTAMRFSPVSSR
jgi:uncharacterized delta-60 repeat protein